MKTLQCIRHAALALLLSSPLATVAQNFDIVAAGVQDGQTFIDAYMKPLGRTFGVNMTSAWYNSAKPLGVGRFEIALGLPFSYPTGSERDYSLFDLGFGGPRDLGTRNFTGGGSVTLTEEWFLDANANGVFDAGEAITADNSGIGPTAFGDRDAPTNITKIINYSYNGIDPTLAGLPEGDQVVATIDAPGGLGQELGLPFPLANPLPPTLQASVGLPKNTQLTVRYLPFPSQDQFDINMWGLGVLHDVKQWIPAINMLPFELSMAFNYSRMGVEVFPDAIVPDPNDFADPNAPGTTYNGPEVQAAEFYGNQRVEFNASAWSLSAIAGKKFLFFSPYGGLRLMGSRTEMGYLGNFGFGVEPFFDETNPLDPNNGRIILEEFVDPFTFESSLTQLGFLAGFKLNFKVISLFAEGSWGTDYPSWTVGTSIGWMNN